MYLGVDLGTSSVKVLLVDEAQRVVGDVSSPLEVSRPRPLWSEQDPDDWWRATEEAVAALRRDHARALAAVRGIGLSGQMHGATLLDRGDRVLRPAILWNDGRAEAECAELERREPRSREITGNLAMPGFTAPKVLWVERHEPEVRRRLRRVLLPKDWLRLRLTGEHASEMSDASGTLWLDVARRSWSEPMLAATGLDERAMPRLCEGSEASGRIRPALADAWGMARDVIVAGGAGDNAAGAAGVGVVTPGRAFLSLGTSGVYFVAGAAFAPNPARAVHAFCHCLPATWHQMSVLLSAASCLRWVTRTTGASDEAALLAEVEAADRPSDVLFLPYLSGERTPHNDPHARGVFFGLAHDTTRADLGRAVLEGVAFAFADGQDALVAAGTRIDEVAVIGGGARSLLWTRILTSALDRPLRLHSGGERGAAFGAARLARLAVTGEAADEVCSPPPLEAEIPPDPALVRRYADRRALFQRLYGDLRGAFREAMVRAT
jgi:xylulokinase